MNLAHVYVASNEEFRVALIRKHSQSAGGIDQHLLCRVLDLLMLMNTMCTHAASDVKPGHDFGKKLL